MYVGLHLLSTFTVVYVHGLKQQKFMSYNQYTGILDKRTINKYMVSNQPFTTYYTFENI